MRVYGFAAVHGGTHFYRIREPLRGLAGIGYLTEFGELFDEAVVQRNDTILTHLLHDPESLQAWQYLHEAGQHCLAYDIDDNIWAYPADSDQGKYWIRSRQEAVEEAIRISSCVTTPSRILHDKIKFELGLHDRVYIIPNYIPKQILNYSYLRDGSGDKFVIGWQPAPQNIHQSDFELVQEELFAVLDTCPNAELAIFGQPRMPHYERSIGDVIIESAGRFNSRITTVPWTTDLYAYYRSLAYITVGIAPLIRSDFTDAKSSLRAVEYMALGIPGLYSDRPPYRGTVMHGRNGFLIEDQTMPRAWRTILRRLYNEPHFVELISRNALKSGAEWTTEGNAHLWERALIECQARDVSVPSNAVG